MVAVTRKQGNGILKRRSHPGPQNGPDSRKVRFQLESSFSSASSVSHQSGVPPHSRGKAPDHPSSGSEEFVSSSDSSDADEAEEVPSSAKHPRATITSKKRLQSVPDDPEIRFPEVSDDPYEWRTKARERKECPFTGPAEGTLGLGLSSYDPAVIIFIEIFGNNLEIVLTETNRYGQKRSNDGEFKYKWVDITKPELLAYFGLVIAMGGCVKKNYM